MEQKITILMDVEDLMSGFAYTHDLHIFTAYRVYRNTFRKRKNELSHPGVYFLECGFGENEYGESQQDERQQIYIGQSGNVFERLQRHHSHPPSGLRRECMEWTSAICFLKDGLTNNTLLGLEKRLFQIFKEELASRFCVHTETVSAKKIKDNKALLDAINEIRMYLAAMGVNTFIKSNIDGELYSCMIPHSDNKAIGYPSAEKFIVKKNSDVSTEKRTNFKPDSYWKLRQELENRGVIKNGRFVCDYEFRSASEAAAVVRGCSSNGQDAWRIRVGEIEMSMKEFQTQ